MESAMIDKNKKKRLMDYRQQESLAIFYKEYFDLDGYSKLYFNGACFCAVFFTCIMFIPIQQNGNNLVQFMAITWAAYLYSAGYSNCTGNSKEIMIYDKLKYLPVSGKQFRLNILRKWVKKCIIIFAISMIGQLCTTWEVYNEINWINVVYVFGMGLIVPVAAAILNLFLKENGWRILSVIVLIVCYIV